MKIGQHVIVFTLGVVAGLGYEFVNRQVAVFPDDFRYPSFHLLADDQTLSSEYKWYLFLINRAEFGMCADDEKLKVLEGQKVCVRTPPEFVEIKQ